MLRENPRLTVRRIAEQVSIDRETVRKIVTEHLDMRKVRAKWSQRSSLTGTVH
jgi:DNA-binding Lrp family transcriptional regulator